ncbi:MAG: murein L,D-transpeptidase catalytic domain family protein [Puia sp.]|nr:murein L,D-transpeptidase catalytic domain family protein [Puia sp.]
MKLFKTTLSKLSLLLLFITGPAMFVHGNTESSNETLGTASAAGYHTADLIRNIIHYRIAAMPLYANNSAEMTKVQAEKEAARLKMVARRAEMAAAQKAELRMVISQASVIYNDMELQDSGLSQKAFEYGMIGYYKLRKKGLLQRTDVLSICDFSQSSSSRRMYVIDIHSHKLLYRTYVAHGINSGEEYANSFSNRPESCKSSLGFYVTRKTYTGVNGLSLRIEGLDKGFNDHANERNIVIHGASYVSLRILHKYGVMGTTFGCPAVPEEMSSLIIPAVKNGTCFFIYYPSKKYLTQSTVLNG